MSRIDALIYALFDIALYGGIAYLITKFAGITYALSFLLGVIIAKDLKEENEREN